MQRFLFNISILYAYSSVPNKQHYILIDFCKALKYKVFMTHPNALSLAFLEGPDFFLQKEKQCISTVDQYIYISCGHVFRDFESEAKIRCNFQFR